jgi:hypothetical protein
VSKLPLILVVEDEYALQGVVEDALIEVASTPKFCLRVKKH